MPWIFSQACYTLSNGLLFKNFRSHAAYDQNVDMDFSTPGSPQIAVSTSLLSGGEHESPQPWQAGRESLGLLVRRMWSEGTVLCKGAVWIPWTGGIWVNLITGHGETSGELWGLQWVKASSLERCQMPLTDGNNLLPSHCLRLPWWLRW